MPASRYHGSDVDHLSALAHGAELPLIVVSRARVQAGNALADVVVIGSNSSAGGPYSPAARRTSALALFGVMYCTGLRPEHDVSENDEPTLPATNGPPGQLHTPSEPGGWSAHPNGYSVRPPPLPKVLAISRRNRSGSMRLRERLRSNCRGVSTLAESWKIMHSCAYMRPGATPSFRHVR